MKKEITCSEKIADFLSFCTEATSKYRESSEFINTLDRATQDLLHQIELGTAKDRDRAATKLANVRKQRRYYKDIADTYEPLVLFITDNQSRYDVPYMFKQLKERLGEIRKRERNKANRIYTPKVVKQLDFVDYRASVEGANSNDTVE